MRELIATIPFCLHGFFEIGHRFIITPELHQVYADVIVGIAKFRINTDGLLRLRYGLLVFSHVAVGPAQVGMSFCRWLNFQ